MLYQSHYPEYSGHNEELFGYYRVDNLYTGQQMYQRPYVALYDKHIIDNKQDDKRRFSGRPYEKNWDLLYWEIRKKTHTCHIVDFFWGGGAVNQNTKKRYNVIKMI